MSPSAAKLQHKSDATAACLVTLAVDTRQLACNASGHLLAARGRALFARAERGLMCVPRPAAGDGMLHAVRIRGGKASFCNRWVRTSRLDQEEKAGWALHTKSEQAGAGAMMEGR